jgi:hypothetical protein
MLLLKMGVPVAGEAGMMDALLSLVSMDKAEQLLYYISKQRRPPVQVSWRSHAYNSITYCIQQLHACIRPHAHALHPCLAVFDGAASQKLHSMT